MHIDPELEEQIERQPDRTVKVIIGCQSASANIEAELKRVGFESTGRQGIDDETFLYGCIRAGDIPKVRNVAGVEFISPDSEQYAL